MKEKSTTEDQKVFALPTSQTTRQRLAREQRQAYDAGKIDAYLGVLKKLSGTTILKNFQNLVFVEPDARKLCFQALDYLISCRNNAESKVNAQQRLLGQLQQEHFDF